MTQVRKKWSKCTFPPGILGRGPQGISSGVKGTSLSAQRFKFWLSVLHCLLCLVLWSLPKAGDSSQKFVELCRRNWNLTLKFIHFWIRVSRKVTVYTLWLFADSGGVAGTVTTFCAQWRPVALCLKMRAPHPHISHTGVWPWKQIWKNKKRKRTQVLERSERVNLKLC